MAVLKILQKGQYVNNYVQFVADTEEDVKKIKILPNGGSMGNEVYVISSQKTYILNSKGVWHSKAIGDDSKIECDCIEESTVWEDLPEPTT
jgi:hypothetical protein